VPFNLDAVKHNAGVEGLVSASGVHLIFPLFDAASPVDHRLRPIKVHVTFQASHTAAGNTFRLVPVL
jgi:hypothetical protein